MPPAASPLRRSAGRPALLATSRPTPLLAKLLRGGLIAILLLCLVAFAAGSPPDAGPAPTPAVTPYDPLPR